MQINNTLKNIFRISASQTSNRFIYFAKRLPLIKRIIPDSIYKEGAVKLILSALIYIIITSVSFFKKALYLAVFIILPIFLLDALIPVEQRFNTGLQIFVFMNFIIGAFQSPVALANERQKYNCVKHMGMKSGDYCISQLVYKNAVFFVSFLPAIIIAVAIFDYSNFFFLEGLAILVLLMFARMIGEAFQLFQFAITKKIIHNNLWASAFTHCVFIGLAYMPIGFGYILDWENILLNPITFIVGLILASFSVWYILKYKHYWLAVRKSMKQTDTGLNQKTTLKRAAFNAVKLKDSDLNLEKEKLSGIDKKEGYDYLNAIFFKRHKRLLSKPIFIRVIIILALFTALAIVALFVPDEENKELMPLIFSGINICALYMYGLSTGDKMAKAMFFNCDISLLQYGFYRKKEVILKTFWIRVKKAILYNIIPAITICVSLVGVMVVNSLYVPLETVLPFFAAIIMLSVFFSVHHIFLYYVFQPYTTELDAKNPFFKLINFVVYIIVFMGMYVPPMPKVFVWVILVVTIIYTLVALILVQRLAPKNFRVK